MGLFDSIFGGESDKGIKLNKAENDRKREGIDRYAQQGRQDIINIIPQVNDTLAEGYQGAVGVSRDGPQSQLALLQEGTKRAQEAVLGGMGAYQNAILGMPTGISADFNSNPAGLAPVDIGVESAPEQVFAKIDPSEVLAGTPPNLSTAAPAPFQLQVTPGQTTNAQVVDMLHGAGKISDYDYEKITESFRNGGAGAGVGWSYGLPAEEMIGWLPDDLHPNFRRVSENIFNAVAAYNPNTNRGS